MFNSHSLLKSHSIIPGFSITLGLTITYLCLIVLIPLSGLFVSASHFSWSEFWTTVSAPRVMSAFKISFSCSLFAAVFNLVVGLMISWVLVRYQFWGKNILDAMVDLPFALPTAVGGITLTMLYTPDGWVGKYLEPLGIKAVFNPLGITIALIFVSLPFVVRTVQPVLEDIEEEIEEAATCLGATRWQTFRLVLMPHLLPALITGFAMAFARSLGEYGSVIFIAGNMPYKSEIVPLVIVTKLEQFDYQGAAAIAVIMLCISFVMLLVVNLVQKWSSTYNS